jgi:AcrR family transcriptional regulator
MDEPENTRRYNAPRRREGARATRRKLLDAAHRLFAERGYAATTLPAIAVEAGVSTPTVTAVFRTKPALLQALIQSTVRGDAAPQPLALRPQWQEMLDEPDPVRQLAMYAANTRRIHEQTTDIFEIVRGAATADLEIAALRQELSMRRLSDTRTVAQSLHGKRALCPGMQVDEATDLLWALGSAEMFRLLVVDRNWPPDRYERWLTTTLQESIVCPYDRPS